MTKTIAGDLLPLERLHHAEAVQPGHLDVEERHVWCVRTDRLQRLFAGLACREHLHLRLGLQQADQPLPAHRLVVGDDGAERHRIIARSVVLSGSGVCAAEQAV